MTVKTERVAELLEKIELGWPIPAPLEDANLLQQGLNAILLRHVDAKKAATGVERLRARYDDWNEIRVAQAQEIAACMRIGAKGDAAARDVRVYLQEVFQQTHGIDLEFLRDDAQASARFVNQLPFMGLGTAHYLLWLAGDRRLPITAGLVRVLDRLGVISRTTSTKKARAAIEPLIPQGTNGSTASVLDFLVRLGEVASRWCDPRKPICHACALVDECKYGKKAFREWKVQQERREAQRKREAARVEAVRKKDEERLRREQERLLRKARVKEDKRRRAADRAAKAEARKRAQEEKRVAREKAKLDAQKKRDQEKARKKAELERAKKAAAKKKKKAEAEKKKKAAAAKKKAAKKKATKKPSTRSGARKKPATRKKSGTKKKPAARKKPATKKKPAARKPARKK